MVGLFGFISWRKGGRFIGQPIFSGFFLIAVLDRANEQLRGVTNRRVFQKGHSGRREPGDTPWVENRFISGIRRN